MPESRPTPDETRVARAVDEVSIFIDADGSVTICDLWEGLLPVAEALGEVAASCPLQGPGGPPATGPGDR